jgi:hypothetical protein
MQVVDRNGRLKVEITNAVDELTVGVTNIVGGVSGRALYDNAGVLGELNLASIYVPLSRTLTINGTTQDLSADRTFTISTGITIGTTAITSGTVGRVLFEGTGNVVQESANLFFDVVNGRFGVNTSTPSVALDIVGAGKFSATLEVTSTAGITLGGGATALSYTGGQLNIGNSASWTDVRFFVGGVQKYIQTSSLTTITNTTINLSTATVQLAGVNALTYSGTDIRIGSVAAGFNSLSMYVAGSEKARIFSTGNIGINTTTDAGFKLDVNGTARVSGNLLVNNTTDFGYRMDVNGNVRLSGNQNTLTGSVLIGTTYSFAASAVLKIDSTTQGFLPPRMTTTQKNAIASPVAGLMVYDTTLNLISVYNGTIWISL